MFCKSIKCTFIEYFYIYSEQSQDIDGSGNMFFQLANTSTPAMKGSADYTNSPIDLQNLTDFIVLIDVASVPLPDLMVDSTVSIMVDDIITGYCHVTNVQFISAMFFSPSIS